MPDEIFFHIHKQNARRRIATAGVVSLLERADRPDLVFLGLGLILGWSGGLGFAFGRGLLGLEQGGGLRGGALGGLGGLQGGALGLSDQLAALGQELGLVGRAGD